MLIMYLSSISQFKGSNVEKMKLSQNWITV